MLRPKNYTPGGVVQAGVRWVLITINAFLTVAGVVMIVLGVKFSQDLHVMTSSSKLPDIWWLGLTPLTVGLVGIVCTSVGQVKLLVAWAVYTPLITTGSYIFFVRQGCFNHATYGVTMRIYGACKQISDVCICALSSHVISVSSQQSCDDIRHVTSLYLSQMVLLTSAITASIIGCLLAFITLCCYRICLFPRRDEHLLLTPRAHRPHTSRDDRRTSTYLADFRPGRAVRSYTAMRRDRLNTML